MQEVQTVSRPAATSRTAVEREARQQASITYRVVLPATEPKTVEPDVENYDATYWYHPSIHNWGNIGWRGRFHATFAPLATWVIDQTSYSGIDVRRAVLSNTTLFPPGASVLDLACGTGFSTSRGAVGIDTSPEMIDIARLRRGDALFRQRLTPDIDEVIRQRKSELQKLKERNKVLKQSISSRKPTGGTPPAELPAPDRLRLSPMARAEGSAAPESASAFSCARRTR